jgi:hypothetical protein
MADTGRASELVVPQAILNYPVGRFWDDLVAVKLND